MWHVPNGEIRRVGNRSKLWSVAVVDVIVAYDADLEATRRVVHDVAAAVVESEDFAGDVLEAPEMLGVESVSPESVTLRLLVKTAPGAQFRPAAGAARGDQARPRRRRDRGRPGAARGGLGMQPGAVP